MYLRGIRGIRNAFIITVRGCDTTLIIFTFLLSPLQERLRCKLDRPYYGETVMAGADLRDTPQRQATPKAS